MRLRISSFLFFALAATLPASGATAVSPPPRTATELSDIPFWRANAGWWVSENTYLDGHMNYNIRAYGSLLGIELDRKVLRQTEYKFYAPGPMALGAGRGAALEGEGVEVDTVSTGVLVNPAGLVRMTLQLPLGSFPPTTVRALTDDSGLIVTRKSGAGVDDYRMFITLPTAQRRYVANFGIIDGSTEPDVTHGGAIGDLRGFSIFRQSRVDATRVESLRGELRQRYNVHTVVTSGADGEARAERLPDAGTPSAVGEME